MHNLIKWSKWFDPEWGFSAPKKIGPTGSQSIYMPLRYCSILSSKESLNDDRRAIILAVRSVPKQRTYSDSNLNCWVLMGPAANN